MTPRMRSENKDATFKVYYSKKVPQQVRFPHKKKIIRRRSTPVCDGSGKRQMVFLPEQMRAKNMNAIKDSESEGEDEDMEEGGGVRIDLEDKEKDAEQSSTKVASGRGKKRKSDILKEELDNEEEPISFRPKRRKKIAASEKKNRSMRIEAGSEDERGASPTEAKRTQGTIGTLRRQSTMTQLLEGRRPFSDTDEPEFKPIKRTPRLSWSGRGKNKGKDKQQRTLTQMIPGMRPLEIMSDEDIEEGLSDLEAQEKESQAYGNIVTQRLAEQGLHQAEGDGSDEAFMEHETKEGKLELIGMDGDEDGVQIRIQRVPSLVVQSVEDFVDVDDEASYQPTQYIDAPITRTRRAPRQTRKRDKEQQHAYVMPPMSHKPSKSRFSLLSTPQKRRIHEIPSSQSPADSPLSTQVSPQRENRLLLKECSGNAVEVPETPSRRRKVTFEEPVREQNPPPTLRRFQSTIQDSEDEEEDEDAIEEDAPLNGQRIGAHTQAIFRQMDKACIHEDGDVTWPNRGSSEHLGQQTAARVEDETSQELGEQQEQPQDMRQEDALHEQSPYRAARIGTTQEPLHDIEMLDLTSPDPPLLPEEQSAVSDKPTNDEAELPAPAEELHSTPPLIEPYPQDTFPSTPMVIQDDSSSDEEDEPHSTPPSKGRQAVPQPAMGSSIRPPGVLEDKPVQDSRSPSAHAETQQSHSSKAEQQLRNEWLTYSQYVANKPPQSSSMNVGPDTYSYTATPLPPRAAVAPATQPSGHYLSQATTVDEVTPKRKRSQRIISANVTPHKIASSFISPSKPPPLFIPSSFPSPAKAAMDSWSSPVYGRMQDLRSSQFGASLDDFSIPLPPPVEDD